MVLEVVKLIQASLAIWGMFSVDDGAEIDGLFCNSTKQAMEDWRKAVNWQEDDGTRKDVGIYLEHLISGMHADADRGKAVADVSSRERWRAC
jgi:hypothetical protein